MNFARLAGAKDSLFLQGVIFMGVFEVAIFWFLWWWGILGRRRVE